MQAFRAAFVRATLCTVALAIVPSLVSVPAVPWIAAAEAAGDADGFLALIGSAAPASRADWLARTLQVDGKPVFLAMKDGGASGYEVSGVTLAIDAGRYGTLPVDHARLRLTPSADGRSCGFELEGAPFGAASRLHAKGSIAWAAGPLGGDRVALDYALEGAEVERLRSFLPNRIDASFGGSAELRGKAEGIVGERTTEDAPASPLRGSYDLTIGWTVLGHSGPLHGAGNFSLDDRSLRLPEASWSWQDFQFALKGWFDPSYDGSFDLAARLSGVDAKKVAAEWQVPPPWQPSATLDGTFTLKGTPGKGMLRYEATTASLDLPALGGWSVHIDKPTITGTLMSLSAVATASFRHEGLRIGNFEFGNLVAGLQWRHDEKLDASSANTTLWGGESDLTAFYRPSEHPAFSITGRLKTAESKKVAAALVPWLALDLDGSMSLSYVFGQDRERKPRWTLHASLVSGRLGGGDLWARLLEALAKADPALELDDAAALAPRPRVGKGTRVDTLFFQLAKVGAVHAAAAADAPAAAVPDASAAAAGDAFDVGGMVMRGGGFQLDADGSFSRASGIVLSGTVTPPDEVTAKLVQKAPWLAKLRGEGPLVLPVAIDGPPSAPRLSLAPGYAELLAKAKRGEPVEAPKVHEAKQVGEEHLADIPGDPSAVQE